MNPTKIAFVDVDTLFDFMDPKGKLYVPGAEELVPNLERLIRHARSKGIPIISTADAHTPDDPEFRRFPPHAVKGEPGQQRIPTTQVEGAVVVPSKKDGRPVAGAPQVVLEKQNLDVFSNPNVDRVLKEIGAGDYYVFGVATEYCVLYVALGLRRRKLPVTLLTDAIRPIKPDDGAKALEEMRAAGVQFATTEEVLRKT